MPVAGRRSLLTALVLACACHRDPLPRLTEVAPSMTERPVPVGCRGFASRPGRARLVRYRPELSFPGFPVQLVPFDAADAWLVAELVGTVRRFDAASTSAEIVADLRDRVRMGGEGGFLGLAIEEVSGDVVRAIVKYTTAPSPVSTARLRSVVARITSHDGGHTFASSSVEEILSIDQPEEVHHGGPPNFGRDGYLYVPTGDGGFDARWRSQDLGSLAGKILRLDTRRTSPYGVPADNPFIGVPGARPEIFALGLRNPYGWIFDPSGRGLWVGDVGEGLREELSFVEAGANLGWPFAEGDLCSGIGCDPRFVRPVYAYPNSGGNAIVAGPVYEGDRFPELRGRLIVADYVTGRIEAIRRDGPPDPILVEETGTSILSLTVDRRGELLLADGQGQLWEIEPRPAGEGVPPLLSQTGCVDTRRPRRAAPGLLPYEVNMPLWSDGTDKARAIAIPEGKALRLLPDASFEAPRGTVAVKTFFWRDRPIETRLLVHHDDGEWGGYSYEWNADGTDATLLEHGKRAEIDGLYWTFPSRSQCFSCHTQAAGRTLGLDLPQLNRTVSIDGADEHLVTLLDRFGLVEAPLGDPSLLPRFPSREDAQVDAATWSRAYLQANCAHCHRPGGPGGGDVNLLAAAEVTAAGCELMPSRSGIGMNDDRVIFPGRPDRSVLWLRMQSIEPGLRMPPSGTTLRDELALARMSEWIGTLSGCATSP